MEMQFNSLSERYKRPFGCVRRHEVCQLMVEVPKDCPLNRLEVVLSSDSGYGMAVSFTKEGESEYYWEYRTEFSLPRQGLYFFHFNVELTTGSFRLFRSGETGLRANEGEQWQITCYPEDFQPPEDFQGAVLYQIFPDRFYREGSCDLTGKLEPYRVHDNWDDTPHYLPNEHGEILNNDFFGGNLKGIEAKLPYLKSLGVDGIYLNPVCMAFSNHRYDTADYKRVDPMLGTEADLANLCQAAHRLGMKVILDGVFSHTGSNSVYFDAKHLFGHGAVSDPDSPYRSWYDFQRYPEQYTSWWGIATLPCVNELNDDYLDFIIRGEESVLAHWLSLGIDGVRLDVADELPDEFIAAFRKRLKELKPDAWLLGEVWEDASNKVSYGVRRKYFSAGELDSVMNYPFRNAILSFLAGHGGDQFRRQIMTIVEHYPAAVLHSVMNSLSTHDTMRILTVFGAHQTPADKAARAEYRLDGNAYRMAKTKLRMAAFLQFMLPGCPCIYYGDEAGMQGFEDPFNRGCFPWGEEDAELVEYFQLLAQCRRRHEALRTGDIQVLFCDDGVCCFSRKTAREHLVFLVSMRDQYDCFVQQPVELLHRGSWGDGVLRLKKYGFFLLKLG